VSDESVIAAIARLTRAHPQINRRKRLNPVGSLLQAHMIDGRPADETIAELEALVRHLAGRI
jgi:hypothetical protein